MKIKQRIMVAVISVILLASPNIPLAYSASNTQDTISVYLDSKPINFAGIQAQIINDYAYAPAETVIEAVTGQKPIWNDAEKSFTFRYGGKSYKLVQSQMGIYINNVFNQFDAPSETIGNTVLVPLKMLSKAMNFEQSWDNTERAVKLVQNKPATSAAKVLSVDKADITVIHGTNASVKVTATGNTRQVKIVDANNNTVVESGSYTANGSSNVFSLKFIPLVPGKYRAIAAGSDGYGKDGFVDINITVDTIPLTIYSVKPSSSNPVNGSWITVTAVTSVNANKVWLYNSSIGSFSETTSYTETDGRRTWTLDYNVDNDYYQSYTVYASDHSGNTVTKNYRLDVISNEPASIYEFRSSSQDIDYNSAATIYIVTSDSVTNLSFSVSGNGHLANSTLSSYSESNGRRYWENTYYAGSYGGSATITVTANPSYGSSVSNSLTVNSRNYYYNSNVFSVTPSYTTVRVGDVVRYEIRTSMDVEYINVSVNGSHVTSAGYYYTDNYQKYWRCEVYANYYGSNTVTFTASYRYGYYGGTTQNATFWAE